MGWQSVYICDAHWEEQEGKRLPVRLIPDGVTIIGEPCYLCSEEATIPVRRNIDEVQGGGRCEECSEEGIVKINQEWWCLNHLGKGFDGHRAAFATGLAEAIGLDVFNDPPDDAA